MKKSPILILGSDGYIGRALVLKLLSNYMRHVIGVDNYNRRKWVKEIGGRSLFDLYPFDNDRYKFIKGDITRHKFIHKIIKDYQPKTIIHLASQPSMPYSQIDSKHAIYTQINNLKMCQNLLWSIKEIDTEIRLIITTTTGIPGQFYETILEEPTFNMANSWYHISRGFDSANCNLAARQWGIQIIEFRTSIVFGTSTEELTLYQKHTRFDIDPFFGTVLNRFIMQKVTNQPITIYGQGNQTKPLISLDDCVHSIMRAVYLEFPKGHTILNQVTEQISIKELASLISSDLNIKHIPNPRKEKEDFTMNFKTEDFDGVLGRPKRDMKLIINEMVGDVRKILKK